MASISTKKRRRTAADALHVSDLPIGFIADVSTYLTKPSRAILAVAFTSSSLWKKLMHRLSPISKGIVSASQWDILDFEDVEKDLANKLTDNDIYAILKCINAHDVLKRLKLCGCINITGIGLNPLRGSAVLEQVDLSLVGKHEKPKINPEPMISGEAVVPILESIISTDGCSLKYIKFPWKWRVGREDYELLAQFNRRYNDMFTRRSSRLCCTHCKTSMRDNGNWMGTGNLHNFICYDCLKPFCQGCADETGEGIGSLQYCGHCEKDYCQECIDMPHCASCYFKKCKGCGDMNLKACGECGHASCEDCINTCDGCNRTCCDDCAVMRRCGGDDCNKVHCEGCYNGKEYDVKFCEECEKMSCIGCKLSLMKKHGVICRACASDTVPLMLDEIAKQKDELTKLRTEVEELRESASAKGH